MVKPSMVVMGRDGRPVHRFEKSSQVSFWILGSDVRTMGIMTDEQLDGRPDNRTDVLRGGAPVHQDRDKCSQSQSRLSNRVFSIKSFPISGPADGFPSERQTSR